MPPAPAPLAPATHAANERSDWLARREVGSSLGIRGLLLMVRLFGRRGAQLPLYLVAAWYTALHADVRRNCCAFWRRLAGRCRLRAVYRQIWTFAAVTLDRVFFVSGRTDLFRVSRRGKEVLDGLVASGRGGILLGAHIGSFEAARLLGLDREVPIYALMHTANAQRINATLRAMGSRATLRVIEIDPDDHSYIFKVQEVVEAGGLVAILADRVGLGEKMARVPFLGERAPFPTGPYALAAALGCPVLLTFGLFTAPDHYRLFCEPFAERLELPRRGRAAALEACAARFARRLEHYVRLSPDNWFNFHDVWEDRRRS